VYHLAQQALQSAEGTAVQKQLRTWTAQMTESNDFHQVGGGSRVGASDCSKRLGATALSVAVHCAGREPAAQGVYTPRPGKAGSTDT
jgi:hypothetical protein